MTAVAADGPWDGQLAGVRRVASRGLAERRTMTVMWTWVFGIGVGLEVLGLVVTASGIWTTWQANAKGEPLAAPVVAWLKRAGWRLNARLPRPWQRGRPPITGHLDIQLPAVTGSLEGTTGWPPLPPDLTAEEAIAVVNARLIELRQQHQEANLAAHRELDALASQQDELGGRVDQIRGQITETARLLRVEGLRGQAVGVGLIAVGLVLQSIGQAGM